jgi:fatty acyl-CoA reductase
MHSRKAIAKLLPAVLHQVKTVYLLVRGKRSVSAAERVEKLLCGALFHQLHEEADAGRNAFAKIRVIEGDLSEDGMGLQESDKHILIDEVDMVIHCAANLTLEAAIQNALRYGCVSAFTAYMLS